MAIPVVSVETMRAWEQATWQQGTTEAEVIALVGESIATWIRRHFGSAKRILILAGKGHNGDDGRAAANNLAALETQVIDVADPLGSTPAVIESLDANPDLVLDCLFGIGLSRPLTAPWAKLIERINRSSAAIISIDVPSGLDAQTGIPMGNAIHADYTLTIGAPKEGMIKASARAYVGYIRPLTEIGLTTRPNGNKLFFSEPQDFRSFPPKRTPNGYKGSHGHLRIIAGSSGYHGAAVLAARAAMRAQPGLITLETMPDCYIPVAAQLQQVMVRPWTPKKSSLKNSALLVGPGLASETLSPELKHEVSALWKTANIPVIADASALDWLPQGPIESTAARVLTPHPGEAARLLRCTTYEIEQDRSDALVTISDTYADAWVVLKGPHTLIGRSRGRLHINATGNPGLAQGGSGDVLAGVIGGFMAQSRNLQQLEKALPYCVWQHGAAADRLSWERPNWIVEDLPNALS